MGREMEHYGGRERICIGEKSITKAKEGKCQERKHQMLQKGLIKYAIYAFHLTIKKLLILVKSNLNETLS